MPEPNQIDVKAGDNLLLVGTMKGAFLFRSDGARENWDVAGPYYDAWGSVLSGDKTAQQALDDAAPAIQQNLDKAWRNWDQNTTG